MSWLFFTLLSVFTVSIANILQRVLMKDDKSNPRAYAVFFHFFIAILMFLFALWHGYKLPVFSINLLFFLLAGLLWGIGTVFVFKSLQLMESSEFTIISSVRSVVTIAASILFLHEPFSLQKVAGTVLILASIFFVTNVKKEFQLGKGIWYALGVVICYGFALVVDALNVKHYDAISYSATINFIIGFILLFLYPVAIKQWKHFVSTEFLKKMLPLGIFFSIQAVAYYLALASGGNASQIGPINQAQVILTVIMAAIFLHERGNLWKKVMAAFLVSTGVLLLK
jgi:transporter family protein